MLKSLRALLEHRNGQTSCLTGDIVDQMIAFAVISKFGLITEHGFSVGSGCGSVGRPVASDTRDTWFESGRRQILSTINCIYKTVLKRRK